MHTKFFRAIANNSNNSGNCKTKDEAVKWSEEILGKHSSIQEVQIFEAVAVVRRSHTPTEVIDYVEPPVQEAKIDYKDTGVPAAKDGSFSIKAA